LPIPILLVLLNLIYNMGSERVSGFRKMIGNIKNNNFEKAAIELADSRYMV